MLTKFYKQLILFGTIFLVLVNFLYFYPQMQYFQGETMGTTYSITYANSLFSHSIDDIKRKVDDILEKVNIKMSTYRIDSELMGFNSAEIGKPYEVSYELIDIVERSFVISHMSNGAYDVTIGSLVNLWGFGPVNAKPLVSELIDEVASKQIKTNQASDESIEWLMQNYLAKLPTEEKMIAALEKVSYKNIIVNSEKNTLTRNKDVFVDLSSIAKGYGVDKVANFLDSEGIKSYMVEIGGEIKVGNKKPNGSPWILGIRGPAMSKNHPTLIITLQNKSLATSGDYLNFFEVNGKKYSHTIDPRTGFPEMNRLAEVAVIHNNTAEADALATMFMVLGDKEGIILANRKGIAAHFTYHSDNGYKTVSSEAFKASYLENLKNHRVFSLASLLNHKNNDTCMSKKAML